MYPFMFKRKIPFAVLTFTFLLACNNNPIQRSQQKISMDSSKINQMTQDKSFTASILVDQDQATAYNAIQNFRAWWSEEIDGQTDKLNETFFYHYKDIHLCKLKLIETVPDNKLVYLVLDNEFNFIKDKTEWVNTKLIFDISKQGEKTKVQFTHEGLVPEYECYNVCNDAWSGYIHKSLYNLITTGQGNPNPKDKDGFNAELAKKWKLN